MKKQKKNNKSHTAINKIWDFETSIISNLILLFLATNSTKLVSVYNTLVVLIFLPLIHGGSFAYG